MKPGRHSLLLLLPLLAAWQPLGAAPHLASSPAQGTGGRPPKRVSDRHTLRTGQASEGIRLLDAALAADPLTSQEAQRRLREMARSQIILGRRHWTGITADWQRAALAFEFLHQHLLVGVYDPACARLQRTLEDGTHNCLTATLLYLVLCRDAGIPAVAIASPGHVAVRINLQGFPHDIETTDRRWQPQPSNIMDQATIVISDRALVSRVHYNLGVGFAREGRFELALRSTRLSYQLDPSHAEARTNLLATINNWSIDLAQRGEYEQAEALIREGLQLDETYGPLRRSEAFLQHRRQSAPFPARAGTTGPIDR